MKYTPFNFMCVTLMLLSTFMVFSSSNWLFLWAGMELNLLSFIPLIMVANSNQETEASIKYFLAQALGSSIMLMASLSMWFYDSIPSNYMSILLFVSLMLKIGMAPCHLWYPSVMTSISWISCLILSTWQKVAPLVVITFIMSSTFTNSILILAAMNAIIGGSVGMNQVHLRTIMAYSSITHMGWMISLASMNKLSLTMTYFFLYSMLIAPIFIILNKFSSNTSMDLNKLMSKTPYLQFIIPLLLLSLGGLPPLTGFMPKWMAIEALSNSNPYILVLLILGAMMNLYFYLNISFNMMMTPPLSEYSTGPVFIPFNLMIPLSAMLLFSVPMFMLMYAMTLLN